MVWGFKEQQIAFREISIKSGIFLPKTAVKFDIFLREISWALVMGCWCRYLSGARCRLFAYGPADTSAITKPHHLLPHLNPDWFYLSGIGLPRLSWKRGR